ncbi:hypothetical protein Tco_0331809 [Tanacetum coccineum]
MRMTSPSLMNPVSLAENHQSCRKNKDGQKVLLNGQTWRPRLLLLCYSMKILNEANSLQKPQEPFDSRKFFGFHVLSPPHIANSCAIDLLNRNGVRAKYVDLAHFADSQGENQPIMPQVCMPNEGDSEQNKAYFDKYDYRVKLLQKKQRKEEVKRMKEMKNRGNSIVTKQAYQEEDGEGDAPAPVLIQSI